MNARYLIILPVLTTLAACAPSSSDSKKDSETIPTSIQFTLPPSQKLTDEQKAGFTQLLKDKDSNDLSSFLVIKPDETAADRQKRETSLREASPIVQATVTRAKQACEIKQPRTLESQTGSGKDVVLHKVTESSVAGKDCPLAATSKTSEQTRVEKLTSTSPVRGLFKTTRQSTNSYTVTDETLLQDLKMTSSSGKMSATTLTDTSDGTFKTKSTIQFNAQANYADGKPMTMKGTVTMLGFGDANAKMTSMKMVAHLYIGYDGVTYVLSVDAEQLEGGKATTKVFLNGDAFDQNFQDLIPK